MLSNSSLNKSFSNSSLINKSRAPPSFIKPSALHFVGSKAFANFDKNQFSSLARGSASNRLAADSKKISFATSSPSCSMACSAGKCICCRSTRKNFFSSSSSRSSASNTKNAAAAVSNTASLSPQSQNLDGDVSPALPPFPFRQLKKNKSCILRTNPEVSQKYFSTRGNQLRHQEEDSAAQPPHQPKEVFVSFDDDFPPQPFNRLTANTNLEKIIPTPSAGGIRPPSFSTSFFYNPNKTGSITPASVSEQSPSPSPTFSSDAALQQQQPTTTPLPSFKITPANTIELSGESHEPRIKITTLPNKLRVASYVRRRRRDSKKKQNKKQNQIILFSPIPSTEKT